MLRERRERKEGCSMKRSGRAFELIYALASADGEYVIVFFFESPTTFGSSGGGEGVTRVFMDALRCIGDRGGPLLVSRRLPTGAVC